LYTDRKRPKRVLTSDQAGCTNGKQGQKKVGDGGGGGARKNQGNNIATTDPNRKSVSRATPMTFTTRKKETVQDREQERQRIAGGKVLGLGDSTVKSHTGTKSLTPSRKPGMVKKSQNQKRDVGMKKTRSVEKNNERRKRNQKARRGHKKIHNAC